jgi:hypothetical protein
MLTATFAESVAAAVLVVLAFDVLGARASKRFGFAYATLAIPAWVLFLLIGLGVQTVLLDTRATAIVAAIAAVVEVTAGSALVSRIGPPRPAMTAKQLIAGSAVAVLSEVAIAFVGATWLFYAIVLYVSRHH